MYSRSSCDCFLCAEQEDVLFETRIEFIIIANIILLPVNTTQPPFLGQGNGRSQTRGVKQSPCRKLHSCPGGATFTVASMHSVYRTCFLLCQQAQRVRYTRRYFFYFFFQLHHVLIDANSLPIQAKVSAVFHMGIILSFVM